MIPAQRIQINTYDSSCSTDCSPPVEIQYAGSYIVTSELQNNEVFDLDYVTSQVGLMKISKLIEKLASRETAKSLKAYLNV